MRCKRNARSWLYLAVGLGCIATLALVPGCWVPRAIGGMAESYQATGSSMIPAEYTGLEGKTWAVVVLADRGIQAEVPNVIEVVTNATTRKLIDAQGSPTEPGPLKSAGFQAAPAVILLQRANPTFPAWTYGRMADELGVERLIVIDINSFRLFERGNQYVWDGRVSARVGVVEADTGATDFTYSKDLVIRFPDDPGYTSDDFSRAVVVNILLDRLTNRAAWVFFDHEEPNVIPY